MVGAFRHFAAGVILYAAASEFLPDATRHPWIRPIAVGGAFGIAVVLLRHLTEKAKESPTGLIAAAALDVLIEDIVLGLGFSAGQHQGLMLAI